MHPGVYELRYIETVAARQRSSTFSAPSAAGAAPSASASSPSKKGADSGIPSPLNSNATLRRSGTLVGNDSFQTDDGGSLATRGRASTFFGFPTFNMPPRRPTLPPRTTKAEDQYKAERALLFMDEDDERDLLLSAWQATFDAMRVECSQRAEEIRAQTVWDGATSRLTAQVFENLFVFLFRAMRSRVQQRFTSTFPAGVARMSYPDTAATALALLMIDIALTDQDMNSFALTVIPRHRVSLTNCPQERLYAFFSFMAFKVVMLQIARSGSEAIEAFRRFVVAHFALPRRSAPSQPAGQDEAQRLRPQRSACAESVFVARNEAPLVRELAAAGKNVEAVAMSLGRAKHALFNCLDPVLQNPHFESRAPAFHQQLCVLQHDVSNAVAPVAMPADPAASATNSAAKGGSSGDGGRSPRGWQRSMDIDAGAGVGPLTKERSPASRPATPAAASSSMAPLHHHNPTTGGGGPARVVPSDYLRAGIIGRGAQGTVYEAVRILDGALLALKELPLPTAATGRGTAPNDSFALGSFALHAGGRAQSSFLFDGPAQEAASPLDLEATMKFSQKGTPPPQPHHEQQPSTMTMTVGAAGEAVAAEINVLRLLRHSNVIQYFGSWVDPKRGVVAILMELAPKSLRRVIDECGGGLPDDLVARYGQRALTGITYLHAQHIIHRDIKAANVLVTNTGEIKVSDFGTAIVTTAEHTVGQQPSEQPPQPSPAAAGDDAETMHSTTMKVQGTPAFLAPEVLAGSTPMEPADVWAFGGMLLEMATGCAPWSTEGFESVMQIAFALLVEQRGPTIPDTIKHPQLRDVLSLCLQRDPCQRPTARELLGHPFFRKAASGAPQS